ncbi:hypothetical protein [Halopiger djelfimassiliensis]|uniref:hypothetical protein n=1 Tax=Halopiger djelfimassiliensis TaxID=1293047 RepID=UPI000677CE5A|nr:hypothetical protein [Halopiger djelfimassiliensis]
MVWQDVLFLVGSLLSVIVLVPAVRNANARIPLATSLPKMLLGGVYAITFASMGMYLAAGGLLATGVMWCLIAAYRSPSVGPAMRSRRLAAVVRPDRRRRLED